MLPRADDLVNGGFAKPKDREFLSHGGQNKTYPGLYCSLTGSGDALNDDRARVCSTYYKLYRLALAVDVGR